MTARRCRPVRWLAHATAALVCVAHAAGSTGAEPAIPQIRAWIDEGRFAQAEEAATAIVAGIDRGSGDASILASAIDTLVEARLRNGRGAEARTRDLAQRAVALHRSPGSLRNMAGTQLAAGHLQQAVALYREAVALDKSSQAGPRSHGLSLEGLGRALIEAGAFDEARRPLLQALTLVESLAATPTSQIAGIHERLAVVSIVAGEFTEARTRLSAASLLCERLVPPHPVTAEVLNMLGTLEWVQGNYPESERFQRRALEVATATLRAGHPAHAVYLAELASSLAALNDYEQAKALLQQALTIYQTSHGPDHTLVAGVLTEIASAHQALGEYLQARPLLERALAVHERVRNNDVALVPIVFNLGQVSHELGDLLEARKYYERAVQLWTRHFGRSHRHVARGLAALGAVLAELGLHGDAHLAHTRALRIRREALGESHPDVAASLAALAHSTDALGAPDKALAQAEDALRIWRSAGVRDAAFGRALAHTAQLWARRNNMSEAQKRYSEAAALMRHLFGSAHGEPAKLDTQVAALLFRAGRGDEAIGLALAAAETNRNFLRTTVSALAERQALAYAAGTAKPVDLIISAIGSHAAHGTSIGRVFDELVRSRAVVLDEIAIRSASGDRGASELAALHRTVATARQRLANLVVRGPDEDRPTPYPKLIETARIEKERAERALAEKSAAFREELAKRAVGLEEVAAAIPPAGALVSIVRYERTIASQPQPVPHYAAFVLASAAAQPVLVQLGTAVEIDRAIARWRSEAALTLPGGAPSASAETTFRVAGDRLRALIWDPLLTHLKGTRGVFVVPDAAVNLVNIAALPVGVSEYLVERGPTIHYLPTERDLVSSASEPSGSGLLALGGPSFDAGALTRRRTSTLRAATCGTLQSLMFGELPGTLREANEVAGLWKAAGSPAEDVRLSTASEATEQAFKRNAPGRRVLHLATHGFFLGSNCEPTAPGTRAVGRVTPARARTPVVDVQNPLLLSGLAFAGANQRAKTAPDQDDGILMAEEISAMNLKGTEWAVLSACDTGLGEIRAGEGVFGLRRAFQIAGVRTVIMSLWSVEDEATRRWMRALYEARLKARLDTAESVRAANVSVLRERRARRLSTHPFYWGAFVAAGDWR